MQYNTLSLIFTSAVTSLLHYAGQAVMNDVKRFQSIYWIGHWRKNLWFLAGSGKIMSLLLRGFLPSVTKPYCSTLYLL